jgi:hypothetical protein
MELILNAAWLIIAVVSSRSSYSAVQVQPGTCITQVDSVHCCVELCFSNSLPDCFLSDDLQEMQTAVVEVLSSRPVIKNSGSTTR